MRLFPLLLCLSLASVAQEEAPQGGRGGGSQDPMSVFSSLRVRNIGPTFISGRVSQFAVFPDDSAHYLVAEASGGVWETHNDGTSWTPIFDSQGSYSIGTVTIDQKNPSIIWVGTGENNDQRSVSYGDGVYKSEDGGRTWHNMGLTHSEHIARIVVDPKDSNVVYVAAPGPLWKGGGDRGIYKTTDGGKTWTSLIKAGEYTGGGDIIMDPRNPDILLATMYMRGRAYFGMIHGGPEGGVYRSIDAGKTWQRIRGIPQGQGDVGRIGLNYAPSNPSIIYAQVEAANGRGGLYRSTDNGVTWERRNTSDSQAQYYAKVQVDPANPDRVYIMNVNIMVSDDGGRTLSSLPTRFKHVDNHDIWVDPKNNNHYLVGCDGGVYESWDRAANWIFKANLSTAQMYDVAVSQGEGPFYHVYGGTQDNNSFGCPAKTKSSAGILFTDCFVTMGGDGFYSRVDPKDPNTIYANMQNGGMVRFDRRTGERVSIQPQAGKGDSALRWNWDAPVIVSPHSSTRLYFGAQKLFRSDDRGDTWRAVSPDLTRNLNRDILPLMGKVWPFDAVGRNDSTAFYDNISSIAESPKQEGLIYVGTDDGLLQVTEDGGKNWRKVEKPTGVPENAYVQRIFASQADPGVVYVAYENHQNGDFKPYLIKSSDKGKTWVSISGNLPETGGVYAIAEDPVNPKLLFAGTEFGLYFSNIGGEKWVKFTGGLPTVMVRDLAIQKENDDLVIGTFGRGIYVLDDYSPLRLATPEMLQKESALFPVKTALSYIPSSQFGGGKGDQGEAFWTAPNPPFGAEITYYLKDGYRTKAEERRQRERDAIRGGEKPPLPTEEELRAEAEEEAPAILVTISDASGKVIRRLQEPATRGIHRVAWDLREQGIALPPAPPAGEGGRGGRGGGGRGGAGGGPAGGGEEEPAAFGGRGGGAGALVVPGKYTVTIAKRIEGKVMPLEGTQSFEVVAEGPSTKEERTALAEFQDKVAKLQKALTATQETAAEAGTRISAIRRAIDATPSLPLKLHEQALALQKELDDINLMLAGDRVWRSHNEPIPPSIAEHIQAASAPGRGSTQKPTKTAIEQYQIGSDELATVIPKLRKLMETDIKALEKQLDAAGAPPTPGRLPDWKPGK